MNPNLGVKFLARNSGCLCLRARNNARPYLREISSASKQKKSSDSEVAMAAAIAAAAAGCVVIYSMSAMGNESTLSLDSRSSYILPQYKARAEALRVNKNGARNVMLNRLRSAAGRDLHSKYNVDWKTVLGEGAYGSVHPARLACTGEKVALKKISKRHTNSSAFRNETAALLRIYDNGGHPNISGLRDMYEDYSHFFLILDLIKGGEMFDHLSKEGAYSEADSARLIFEVASALAFLHGGRWLCRNQKNINWALLDPDRGHFSRFVIVYSWSSP
jgi:hypothetical protein